MFAKLLKYEFKSTAGVLGILSVVSLVASLMIGLIFRLMDALPSQSVSGDGQLTILLPMLCIPLLVGCLVAIIAYGIVSMLLLYGRFYTHKFTDQGYLTFTLPVTVHQLLLSSLVNILIWGAICVGVYILDFLIICLTIVPDLDAVTVIINEVQYGLGELLALRHMDGGTAAVYLITALTSVAQELVLPMVAITIGALAVKKHKILAAFGIYYGISWGIGILSSGISVFTLLANEAPGLPLLSPLVTCVMNIFLAVGGYFLTHFLLREKLNLS